MNDNFNNLNHIFFLIFGKITENIVCKLKNNDNI